MCLIMSVQHQTNITEENKGSRVCLIYLTTLYDSYNCKYDTFCHKDNIYMTSVPMLSNPRAQFYFIH